MKPQLHLDQFGSLLLEIALFRTAAPLGSLYLCNTWVLGWLVHPARYITTYSTIETLFTGPTLELKVRQGCGCSQQLGLHPTHSLTLPWGSVSSRFDQSVDLTRVLYSSTSSTPASTKVLKGTLLPASLLGVVRERHKSGEPDDTKKPS
jgi:hypothetical protein